MAVTTETGQLLVCGSNNKGQLGINNTEDAVTLTLITAIKDKVTMVTGGWDFSVAVTGSLNVDILMVLYYLCQKLSSFINISVILKSY